MARPSAAPSPAPTPREAPLDISVKADPLLWAERLAAEVLPTGSLRRPAGGAVADLPGYGDGAWWVQDAAAALPVRLFGPARPAGGSPICAPRRAARRRSWPPPAPRSSPSTVRPRGLAACRPIWSRLGLAARVVAADAATWRPEEPLDLVLLDAPCSATGTLRRHPDVAWLKRPADLAKLCATQDRLLAAAVDMLAPGGLLVYCTCSLQAEEGALRVDALLAAGAPVRRRPIEAAELGGTAELDHRGRRSAQPALPSCGKRWYGRILRSAPRTIVSLPSMTPARRFVLLDRDGTLNVDRHYLSDPAQLELYPGVLAALRRLRELGFGLVVVTNQSGVARGYFDLATVARVNARLVDMLAAGGVALDGIYYCPHGADSDCACRKPRPGMVEQAVADHGFDPRQAFVVGDKAVDVALAEAVGATGILVRTGWGAKAERQGECAPAAIVDDLPAAVAWIERSVGFTEGAK